MEVEILGTDILALLQCAELSAKGWECEPHYI